MNTTYAGQMFCVVPARNCSRTLSTDKKSRREMASKDGDKNYGSLTTNFSAVNVTSIRDWHRYFLHISLA
ncbi:hypothetical protein QQ020_12925 [Fulvivirgaceae bacterium BMA12]|uniref:Uncharacterized protein n=1 Tax=Agaribacillus aureus TaxID=3051825 RepID=A0ABT8L5D9_9BACT|nr:hypothetical protein [Fulvivirgaceae bacterium BMA12]